MIPHMSLPTGLTPLLTLKPLFIQRPTSEPFKSGAGRGTLVELSIPGSYTNSLILTLLRAIGFTADHVKYWTPVSDLVDRDNPVKENFGERDREIVVWCNDVPFANSVTIISLILSTHSPPV